MSSFATSQKTTGWTNYDVLVFVPTSRSHGPLVFGGVIVMDSTYCMNKYHSQAVKSYGQPTAYALIVVLLVSHA